MAIDDIPGLNASLNAVATVLILAGFVAIKTKRPTMHRACMVSAFIVSVFFLIGYVGHKIAVGGVHTRFGGTGAISIVYHTMLISHIILAMVIVPLILRTFFLAIKGDFDRHRAWARWTFPTWFYVSATGVLIYFFLYRWYPVLQASVPTS